MLTYIRIYIHTYDTYDNYWGTGHVGHGRNMYGKLLMQFRDYAHGEGRLGYPPGKNVTTLSTQPSTRDIPDENNLDMDGEYSGCEIEITPSPSSATPMSTKPPRKQPRKRVIICSSSSLPTRPSSGMSTTPLISACTPTYFTQAPLYSTVLSSPTTSTLSVSADNTPATRAARTSTRVRKRQTVSLSPGSLPLSSTTITTPSSAATTTTPCRDQITRELSSVSATSSPYFSPNAFPPLRGQLCSPEITSLSQSRSSQPVSRPRLDRTIIHRLTPTPNTARRFSTVPSVLKGTNCKKSGWRLPKICGHSG